MTIPAAYQPLLPFLPWVLAALLFEAACYLTMGSARAREWWTVERMVGLAPVSYLLYAVPAGVFDWRALAGLLGLVLVCCYWFRVLPKRRWAEVLFLLVLVAPILFPVFPLIYERIGGGPRLDILGKLLWIRVALVTVLREVRPEFVEFGFWPRWRDWRIGTECFVVLLPVLFPLTQAIGFARFEWPSADWSGALLRGVGTFAGSLLVQALCEEFAFRGLVQRWIRPAWLGVAVASVLFGLSHLAFRAFPNYRMVVLATVAGVFYGWAAERAGGIRAALVTHTLTNVAWRMFFVS